MSSATRDGSGLVWLITTDAQYVCHKSMVWPLKLWFWLRRTPVMFTHPWPGIPPANGG